MGAIKHNLPEILNKNILDVIGDNSIFTISDELGRIDYASESFCNILQYNSKDLIGETLELLKSPLHTNKIYKKLWKNIKSGQNWSGVLSVDTKSGDTVRLDTTIIPMTVDGAIIYVIIYKDITQHYNANSKLIENDYKNKSFLKSMPLHVFSLTKYGKILNVNKGYFNTKIDDIIGNYIYDYIGFNWYDLFKKNIHAVFKDKSVKQFEYYDYNADGKKLFYYATISPVYNDLGGIMSLMLCIQETTNYISNSKESLDNEEKYRLIYQSINVGIIIVTDNRGKITEWNKGAELAFGYSEKEIIGRNLSILISEKYRKKNIRELFTAIKRIRNNQKGDLIEMHCLRECGEEFPVEITLSSLKANGKTFYCAMMLDISKRKAYQKKLKQKTKDLELFLYRSAHDLKAPIASAKGLINLLKTETDTAKVKNLICMLDKTMNKGELLSSNLSEASLITAKKHEYKKIKFRNIIDEILKTLNGTKNFNFIDFKVTIDAHIHYKSKPELMVSIFQNLIENAIKYAKTPSANHKPTVSIKVLTENDNLLISVCDNGIGIKPKDLTKVFGLYYRSANKNIPGSGLGLYIVKSIVEGLEGTISVKNDVNCNTCFQILLP